MPVTPRSSIECYTEIWYYFKLENMFEEIVEKINSHFSLAIQKIETISGGADFTCQKYLLSSGTGHSYFLKVQKENKLKELLFLEYLNTEIGENIIVPIKSIDGNLNYFDGNLYYCVFPFIESKNGFEQELKSKDLNMVGEILKKIHSINTDTIKKKFGIPSYKMNFHLVDKLININKKIAVESPDELLRKLFTFINAHHNDLMEIINIANSLKNIVIINEKDFVLCHSDIHAGNILKSEEEIFLIDWDQPVIAHKELDLLFFGGGIAGKINNENDENSFLAGYGETKIDYKLIVLFQILRIFEDLYIYYNSILNEKKSDDERYIAFDYFKENFLPGNTIDCTKRFLKRINYVVLNNK